jgi:hypothetical protein
MTGPIFDRIAMVDWSASATPSTGTDSIWIAVLDVAKTGDGALTLTNPSTRHAALEAMAALAEPGRRTLLGVDFSLGYPTGTAAACGLTGVAWDAMWGHLGAVIVDDERNHNNRFAVASGLNAKMGIGAGPFWGCPPSKASDTLTSTKPDREESWPDEWRVIESRLRRAGRRPFSAWQLLGAGAVGGQSLVGIAALDRLRRNLGRRMAIWPFTTGLQMDLHADQAEGVVAEVVVAEVWPSLWDVMVPDGVVKDAAQVEFAARHLAALDESGELEGLFRPELDAEIAAMVTEEEGWLLGMPLAAG